jgi:hypothetical protein
VVRVGGGGSAGVAGEPTLVYGGMVDNTVVNWEVQQGFAGPNGTYGHISGDCVSQPRGVSGYSPGYAELDAWGFTQPIQFYSYCGDPQPGPLSEYLSIPGCGGSACLHHSCRVICVVVCRLGVLLLRSILSLC